MARIDEFWQGSYRYDLERLKHDLLGKILEEHRGEESAISHIDICHYYFDPYPIRLEEKYLISNILQDARGELQKGGYFLDYLTGKGWYACCKTGEAFDHVLRYAKREVRLHHKLQRKSHIAIGDRYQIPAGNPLIKAIQGTTPAIEQLEEAVENPEPPEPPQLEEGHNDENKDKS